METKASPGTTLVALKEANPGDLGNDGVRYASHSGSNVAGKTSVPYISAPDSATAFEAVMSKDGAQRNEVYESLSTSTKGNSIPARCTSMLETGNGMQCSYLLRSLVLRYCRTECRGLVPLGPWQDTFLQGNLEAKYDTPSPEFDIATG